MRLSGPADFFNFILYTVCSTSSILKGMSRKTSSFWKVPESRVEDCLIDSFSAGFVSSCDLASVGSTLVGVVMDQRPGLHLHEDVYILTSRVSVEYGNGDVSWFGIGSPAVVPAFSSPWRNNTLFDDGLLSAKHT